MVEIWQENELNIIFFKSKLTATILGVCRWMIHLMSGLAWWMAEWSMKPAWFTPKFVVPSSTCSPWKRFCKYFSADILILFYLHVNFDQTWCSHLVVQHSKRVQQKMFSILTHSCLVKNILKQWTKIFECLHVPWHGYRSPASSRTARSTCRRRLTCIVTPSLPWRRPWSRYRGCHWSGPRSARRAQSLKYFCSSNTFTFT